MPFDQSKRSVTITTELGANAFAVTSFSGHEELGRLFEYEAELLSENPAVDFNKVIGSGVTVSVATTKGSRRSFHGIVSRLVQRPSSPRFGHYRATLVPWFWLLTRTSDCRIYQEHSVPEIIADVFTRRGFNDRFENQLARTYTKWEYCVQYRETDFSFVSRLMEQEGIYYYFRHEEGRHILVLVDSPDRHTPAENYAAIIYRHESDSSTDEEHINEWILNKELQPGSFSHTDYDFKNPRKNLTTEPVIRPRSHAHEAMEIFDFPGEFVTPADGKAWAEVRLEELQSRHEVIQGRGDTRGLTVGCVFDLQEFPRRDQNRGYLVLSTVHHIEGEKHESGETNVGDFFQCQFTAIPATTVFRPARLTPKPAVQGPQTAVVVGRPGDEIYTDQWGRVKVHFFWDRHDQSNHKSSCWIRVSQPWAGKQWGAIYIPRVGQEVIVEFLEGDPDQPIIMGRVYNEEQKVPYDLPAEATKSTLKSNSSMGGVGFNEIRFEDKKGHEQIFVHAERNMDVRVKRDSMERVIANRHRIVGWEKDGAKGGDVRDMVYQDQHLKVHRNLSEHIGGDAQLLVGGIDGGPGNQDIVLRGTRKELIEKDGHLHIKGNQQEAVDGNQSLIVGGSQQEKIGQKHAVEAGQEIHLKAGMKVILEAGVQLTIKGAGGFVDIGPAGVTIQGNVVLINSGGSAGSGSGSNPTKPQDASEAAPAIPHKADDARSGQKSSRG